MNYCFGQGLYMAPSDMLLKVGQIEGYNNKIVIAGPGVVVGGNAGLNMATLPPVETPEETPPATEPQTSQGDSSPVLELRRKVDEGLDLDAHEEQRLALVLGGVAVGLVALWLLG